MEAKCARPEPLDFETWLEAIQKAKSLLPQEPDEIVLTRALRRAFHLSQLTPDPVRAVFATDWTEDDYERLLGAGQLQDAARALLAPDYEVELSKPDGKFVAVVRASEIGAWGSGASSHPATAILEAWFASISAIAAAAAEGGELLTQDQHRSQPGPHPSSSQH